MRGLKVSANKSGKSLCCQKTSNNWRRSRFFGYISAQSLFRVFFNPIILPVKRCIKNDLVTRVNVETRFSLIPYKEKLSEGIQGILVAIRNLSFFRCLLVKPSFPLLLISTDLLLTRKIAYEWKKKRNTVDFMKFKQVIIHSLYIFFKNLLNGWYWCKKQVVLYLSV